MKTTTGFTYAAAAVLCACLPFIAAAQDSGPARPPVYGRWDGSLVAEGKQLDLSLRFIAGGALLDVPSQMLFGLPVSAVEYGAGNALRLELPNSVPLVITASYSQDAISGAFSQGDTRGTVRLAPIGPSPEDGQPFALDTGSGIIHGTLVLPSTSAGKMPVALLVSGAGPTDRDGNNYTMPGKNDALRLLARGLAAKGIASLRYDKRGAGEGFPLVKTEADLVFDDYIADAAAITAALKADGRFSRVAVIGDGEGALVGSNAARLASADRFISLCGSAFPMGDVLMEQLAAQSEDQDPAEREALLKESASIIEELKNGRPVSQISQDLMDLFRPSVQPYFISWFAHDPRTDLSALTIPVQIVQGDNDLQVSLQDAEALRAAKPDASYVVMIGMNHVLRIAPEDAEANFTTYSDPELPLAAGLIETVSDFILN